MSRGRKNRTKRRTDRFAWVRQPDERLMEMPLRRLGLRLEGTPLEERVEKLYAELEARDLPFRPRVWLSSEWFSPDGIPGIAAPFYLAHERLTRLEARQMLEVEGGTQASCMRVLRHEAGHAIDTAYRLHFKKRWRETFGRYSQRYPNSYRPKPNSRDFVVHLDSWYAQAHPAEDFAETFAVWLTPRSRWRKQYSSWPNALRKLEYVDEVMHDLRGRRPLIHSRRTVDPLSRLSITLGQYYREKRERYGAAWPDIYDRDLRKLFSSERRYAERPAAARFLRGLRPELRRTVAEWTGAHTYTIDQVLHDMIERCRELKLRVAMPRTKAKTQATILLTVHTMNCLYPGRNEIPL